METVINCPYCGILSTFKSESEPISTEYCDPIIVENGEIVGAYNIEEEGFITKCQNSQCKRLFLVTRYRDESTDGEWKFTTVPRSSKKVNSPSIPYYIREDLNEAFLCHSIFSNKATCIMCRRVLEMCCKHFNTNGDNLEKKVEDLLGRIFPNETLKKRAHLIRDIGNEAAHEKIETSYWSEVEGMLMFTEELVHHIFVTEEKFKELEKSIKTRKDKSKQI